MIGHDLKRGPVNDVAQHAEIRWVKTGEEDALALPRPIGDTRGVADDDQGRGLNVRAVCQVRQGYQIPSQSSLP